MGFVEGSDWKNNEEHEEAEDEGGHDSLSFSIGTDVLF